MTPKQERFVAEYLVDLNATQAAIRAGYSPKVANREGTRLLSNAVIAAAVAEKTQAQLAKVDITAERVKARLATLAFVDPRKFFNADGTIKPITDLDEDTAASIAQFEVIKKNAEAGDGHMDTVHKVRLVDSTKPLNTLAEHFGLMVQKVEHSGALEIKWAGDE
jgi:phage terminase small subunit